MTVRRVQREIDSRVVLAIGGSAGSVQPLVEIVRDLPGDLAATVLITIHVGEQTRLPQILSRSGPCRQRMSGTGRCSSMAGSTLLRPVGISSLTMASPC
jgi:CheB methylesterase